MGQIDPLRRVLTLIPDPLDQIMTFYNFFFLIPLLTNYCQILPKELAVMQAQPKHSDIPKSCVAKATLVFN